MMLRRLLLNAGSIVTHETLNRATTFVLYLIVARYLDDAAFGRLSLSLTLLYIVQVLAGFGLRTYMSREVARDRTTAGRYLGNGLVVSLAASLVALGLLAALTWGAGYPPETRLAVLLFGLGAVPYAVGSVCQGLFQGLERMQLIPAVNVPANVLKLAAAVLLLEGGSDIGAVALAVTGSQLLAAGVSLVLALRLVGAAGVRAAVDRESLVAVARGSAAFMGIDAVVAVWSVLPLFLLSLYASEAEVGHFGAATQLLVPASLVVTAVMVAALPTLSRGFVEGAARLRGMTHALLAVTLAIAVPAAAGLVFLAPDALRVTYGPSFEEGALALRVMAPMVVFQAVTTALGDALLAGLKERVTLRIVALNSLVALLLGLLLTPRLGATGAALAALTAGVVNVGQHYLPAVRLLGSVRLLKAGWRPVVAALAMVAVLDAARVHRLVPGVLLGGAVYLVTLTLLLWPALGGPRGLRARLAQAWTRS